MYYHSSTIYHSNRNNDENASLAGANNPKTCKTEKPKSQTVSVEVKHNQLRSQQSAIARQNLCNNFSQSDPFYKMPPLTADSSSQHFNFRNHGNKKVKISSVVIVGDPSCGKTSLILTYLNKNVTLPDKSVLFDTYEKIIHFNNADTSIKLQIWDFPGDEYFDRFRPLGYANAKSILICFSIVNINSLNNIKERWIPEILKYCPNAYKIIVGTGSEVRFDDSKVHKIPSYQYCYNFSKSLGCKYMECSLIDQKSCSNAFHQIAVWNIDELNQQNFATKTTKKLSIHNTVRSTASVKSLHINHEHCLGSSLTEDISNFNKELSPTPTKFQRQTSYRENKSRCNIM
ncbi:hypothetical protein WICMUC_002884 [Wickerhamomyces mucosus]|uniref:Uncharacterized protein n=1 Tax=Wickerhamomyces mucosus TaxID=1378264 RepID=A0A9P8PNB5_9ASCO|nr:hypothetical protein WICMUC_002884 [Wickerhamomyces mucosus]